MRVEKTVERNISSLQPGEHLCCFSGEGQPALAARLDYLSAGLALGQKVLYLYHDSSPRALLAALQAGGLPVQPAYASGQLVLARVSDFYNIDDLNPQDTVDRLRAAVQQALSAGYPALRVAVEMNWSFPLLRRSASAAQLARCEALFSLPENLPSAILLCLYDRHCADPGLLLDVLTAHPLLLEEGQVYANPCCLPAEVFLSPQRGAALLDMHLRAITHYGRNPAHNAAPGAADLPSPALIHLGPGDALASVHAALRESENRYRTIFDAATEAILIHDLSGSILEANQVACERLGYAMHELLGKKTAFLEAPELAGQAEVRLALLRAYQVLSYETVQRARGGELIPVEVNARLIEYAGRQVVLSIARDITDRKHAELSIVNANQALASANEALEVSNQALQMTNAALRESEQKFRMLVESSPNGIMLISESGHLLEFNPANESIYGAPAGHALGMHIVDFYLETLPLDQPPEAHRACAEQMIAAALETGQADWLFKVREREIRSFDGRQRYVQSTGFPIRTERGMMIGLVTRDVTAHRLAEMELEEYRQRLEGMVAERTEQLRHEIRERQQVEQNLEAMLREIHHRVKNNLNVMIALIDLQKSAHPDPYVVETFKELQTRAYTMALVHESLYRSPNLAQVDFSSYLQTLLDYLQSAYAPVEAGGLVRLLVAAEEVALPIETAIPCGLIVNELVTNALKYAFPLAQSADGAPAGWEGCQVQVHLERLSDRENDYLLTVHDNGVGLPPDLDWQSSPSLGLQLVRVLARQLGGQIELQPGPGTCWRLEFSERR